jgi:hypothetical protein
MGAVTAVGYGFTALRIYPLHAPLLHEHPVDTDPEIKLPPGHAIHYTCHAGLAYFTLATPPPPPPARPHLRSEVWATRVCAVAKCKWLAVHDDRSGWLRHLRQNAVGCVYMRAGQLSTRLLPLLHLQYGVNDYLRTHAHACTLHRRLQAWSAGAPHAPSPLRPTARLAEP